MVFLYPKPDRSTERKKKTSQRKSVLTDYEDQIEGDLFQVNLSENEFEFEQDLVHDKEVGWMYTPRSRNRQIGRGMNSNFAHIRYDWPYGFNS